MAPWQLLPPLHDVTKSKLRPKGIITASFNATKIQSQTRSDPLKRTIATYMLLVGLTATMIGLYLGESKVLSGILSNYTALLP